MHRDLFIKLSRLFSFFFFFLHLSPFPGSLEGKGEVNEAGMFPMTTAPSSTALGKLGSGGGRSGALGFFFSAVINLSFLLLGVADGGMCC